MLHPPVFKVASLIPTYQNKGFNMWKCMLVYASVCIFFFFFFYEDALIKSTSQLMTMGGWPAKYRGTKTKFDRNSTLQVHLNYDPEQNAYRVASLPDFKITYSAHAMSTSTRTYSHARKSPNTDQEGIQDFFQPTSSNAISKQATQPKPCLSPEKEHLRRRHSATSRPRQTNCDHQGEEATGRTEI